MSIDCPKCYDETSVIDSRRASGSFNDPSGMVRRRRKCVTCGYRFTTFELSDQIIRKFLDMDRQSNMIRGFISGQKEEAKTYKGRISEVLRRLQKDG